MLTQSYADFSMNINLNKFKNVVVTIKRTLQFKLLYDVFLFLRIITTLYMADTNK